MNNDFQTAHILMLDVADPAGARDDARWQRLAVLGELVATCDAYRAALERDRLLSYTEENRLTVLFLDDSTGPVKCAVELWDILRELPPMHIRTALHTGEVRFVFGNNSIRAEGDGIDEARRLLEDGWDGQILMTKTYAEPLGTVEDWASQVQEHGTMRTTRTPDGPRPQRLVFLAPDSALSEPLALIEAAMVQDGHEATSDREPVRTFAWAKEVEDRIRNADIVVAFVSDASSHSESLGYQLEVAIDEQRKRGRPLVLPVWLGRPPVAEGPLASLNRSVYHAEWRSAADNDRVVQEVRAALKTGLVETEPERLVPSSDRPSVDEQRYIRRKSDTEFEEALHGRESIVLVKGARQTGKTTVIRRGMELARRLGWRTALTDFQLLSGRQLDSENDFYRVLASTLDRVLGLGYDFDLEWLEELGPNLNMDRFLRTLLEASDEHLVWFIDDADRLFSAPYSSDFFGLVRSWHNARATDPTGPRGRLTLVIGYATDAHLFIRDLNKSPFNVGVSIKLEMFTLDQVAVLNDRYGKPFVDPNDVRKLYELVGGHPFLTRLAMHLVAQGEIEVDELFATADQDDGPFADHLKRVLLSVSMLPAVWQTLSRSLEFPELPDSEGLQRLIAAGILARRSEGGFELPIDLYRRYFSRFVDRDGGASR